MKNLFVLYQMMQATQALLDNQAIYLDPYMAYMVPPILTCCTGRHLGPTAQQASSSASSETVNGHGVNGTHASQFDHFELRTYAASLLSRICQKGSATNQGLKARIARTCLKQFMDPDKSPGTHYGALRALMSITHSEGVQILILPNLKAYNDDVLKVKLAEETGRNDIERVIGLLLRALESVATSSRVPVANGTSHLEDLKERLTEKVGDVLTDRIISRQRNDVAQYLLKANVSI